MAGRRSLLILTTTRNQKGDFRPRSRGEGNQSSLIAVTLEFLDSNVSSQRVKKMREARRKSLFSTPLFALSLFSTFLIYVGLVSKDNRNILRRRKNYLDLTYSKIYSNMFVYVCIRVSSCFQRIFFLFSR